MLKSNSFVFEFKKMLNDSYGCIDDSPFMGLSNDYRNIFMMLKGRLLLYRALSKEISDTQVKRTLDKMQIYVNMNSNKVSTDFINDYRRLRKTDKCEKCDKVGCLGIYEIDMENHFKASEEIIRRLLEEHIDGKILDIGCGNTLYEDIISAKKMDYLGIDVHHYDNARLKVISGDFMSHEFSDAFDAVLAFRSINHFEDTVRFLEKADKSLKEGGYLFIVENELFGELKTSKGIFEANPKTDFEHYHNHENESVSALLNGFDYEVISSKSVDSSTGNQWHLLLKKNRGKY